VNWRALDPRVQWRNGDRWSRVVMVWVWAAAVVVFVPGVPHWLRWWSWLLAVAGVVVFTVRELRWLRRTRRMWDAFLAELDAAGGYEGMDAGRRAYWVDRLGDVGSPPPGNGPARG
jgi:Flp pilus assembly protein TadB